MFPLRPGPGKFLRRQFRLQALRQFPDFVPHLPISGRDFQGEGKHCCGALAGAGIRQQTGNRGQTFHHPTGRFNLDVNLQRLTEGLFGLRILPQRDLHLPQVNQRERNVASVLQFPKDCQPGSAVRAGLGIVAGIVGIHPQVDDRGGDAILLSDFLAHPQALSVVMGGMLMFAQQTGDVAELIIGPRRTSSFWAVA